MDFHFLMHNRELQFCPHKLILFGSADEVADKILEFREEVGDFGTLLYAGHDWADVDLAKNSMKLMADKVMPKINKYTKIAAEQDFK